MKKIFTLIALIISSLASNAQICENFNAYDTTTAGPDYNGFTLTYYTIGSYYTSTQSSGPSGPNSYKFGRDSCSMITPDLTGYDSISFWMKGNASTGGSMANSQLILSESPDGVTYTVKETIIPVASVSETKAYYLTPGTRFVMFYYDKDSGNVAFDDFCASVSSVGIVETSASGFVAYPNPTRGQVNLTLNTPRNSEVIITDVLGNELKRYALKASDINPSIDLGDYKDGVYFVKLKSENGESSKRIVLKK
ncbi:MAG: T9SS type A sorting domain-containing protein [Bacteroidota bacterium]